MNRRNRMGYVLFENKSLSNNSSLALISFFAVLYTVFRLIPTFPMIGATGTFSASDVVSPLYGLLLGPYIGGASIILGTFLSIVFGRPPIFLGLDFLPALVGAVALGLLVRRRFHLVSLFYSIIILFFLVNPLTLISVNFPYGMVIPFNWLHFIAFIILISPLSRKALNWITADSSKYLPQGLLILCFIGTMMQHLTGAILFENIFGFLLAEIPADGWPAIWTTIFYLYPIERIMITVIATIIGSALFTTLGISRKTR